MYDVRDTFYPANVYASLAGMNVKSLNFEMPTNYRSNATGF